MNLQVILLLLALLGAGLAAMLALFLALQRELRFHIRKQRSRMDEIHARIEACAADSISLLPAGPEPRARPLSGLNISKRVQIIRLLRRGEDTGQISALLGVPRREAELIIRVHRIASGRSVQPDCEQERARS